MIMIDVTCYVWRCQYNTNEKCTNPDGITISNNLVQCISCRKTEI